MSDEWLTMLERELHGERVVDPEFVNFVTHAPMPARMRNELINRGYARMANRLNALLGAGAYDFMPPNFFCFAHWASSYVGTRMGTVRGRLVGQHLENGNAVVFHSMSRAFLAFEREVVHAEPPVVAERAIDRLVPAAPRVNSDIEALLDRSAGVRVASLAEQAGGLPASLVSQVDPADECGSGELLARIRRRGFDEYRRAIVATNDQDRHEAILRGNGWLVISEQAMVDAALTRAMRSLVRSVLHPINAVRRSRRTWRNGRVGPVRHGLEDAWIELLSKALEWPSPDTVLSDAAPLPLRPNGPASVHRWLRTQKPVVPSGDPFAHFSLPDLDEERLFWTSLGHRLPVIFAVLQACHGDKWFENGKLIEHVGWDGFDDAATHYLDAAAVPSSDGFADVAALPDAQRREDWATAARLFHRDRELVLAALFTRSLPATYTSPAGAALLDLRAHGLEPCAQRPTPNALADDSLPRLRASATFLEAMFMSPAPPGPSCTARREGRTKLEWLDQVERVHAHVRGRISAAAAQAGDRVPDRGHFDDPLGYEQCIGAGVSFVVPVVGTLEERYAICWSQSERDSWARVWAEITLHQGLNAVLKDDRCDDFLGWGPEHKPLLADFDYDDFVVADREIRARHEARSLSGVRLADKLRRDLEDAIPFPLRPLIRVGFDVFGDARVNRLLLLPESRLTPMGRRLVRRSPAMARLATRRFLPIVLRELEQAVEESPWDKQFAPGFDARRVAQSSPVTLAA